jgi:hypothetical protein
MNVAEEEERKRPADSPITERDVKRLTQSVQEASCPSREAAPISEPELDINGDDEEQQEDEGSYYWDPSTMSPLNSSSLVSI